MRAGLGLLLGALLALHGCEETKASRTQKVVPETRVAERNQPTEFGDAAAVVAPVEGVGGTAALPGTEECPGTAGDVSSAPVFPDAGSKQCAVPTEFEVFPGDARQPADWSALKGYLSGKVLQDLTWGCFDCSLRGCYGDYSERGGGLVFVKVDPGASTTNGATVKEIEAVDEANSAIGEGYGCGAKGTQEEKSHKSACIPIALWSKDAVKTTTRKGVEVPKDPMRHCSKELRAAVQANPASLYNAIARDPSNGMEDFVQDPKQPKGKRVLAKQALYRKAGGPPPRPASALEVGDAVARDGAAAQGAVVSQHRADAQPEDAKGAASEKQADAKKQAGATGQAPGPKAAAGATEQAGAKEQADAKEQAPGAPEPASAGIAPAPAKVGDVRPTGPQTTQVSPDGTILPQRAEATAR